MMGKQVFNAFIDLVTFDQSIAKLLHQIEVSKQSIQDCYAQEQALILSLDQAKQKLLEWRKLVDEKELLLKTLEDQECAKKERLEQVHNNKEYMALQGEVSLLRLEQHNLEQEIIDAWNKRDMAHAEYDIMKEAHHTRIAQLHTQIREYQQSIEALEMQCQTLRAQRVSKESAVPHEWLEKYNVLGTRIADPVVALEGDSCGGCFSPLTNQELMRLHRGALLQCQSCFRFIYAPSAVEHV